MYLLDTNHCSQIIFGNPIVIAKSEELGESKIATSMITKGELIYMAENSQYREDNLNLFEGFLQNITIYNVNSLTGQIYGKLRAKIMQHFGPKDQKKRRRIRINDLGISENDLWIAAITIQHNCVIVSSDNDFLRIKSCHDIVIETWYNPADIRG